jgi:hypothetical protein
MKLYGMKTARYMKQPPRSVSTYAGSLKGPMKSLGLTGFGVGGNLDLTVMAPMSLCGEREINYDF